MSADAHQVIAVPHKMSVNATTDTTVNVDADSRKTRTHI